MADLSFNSWAMQDALWIKVFVIVAFLDHFVSLIAHDLHTYDIYSSNSGIMSSLTTTSIFFLHKCTISVTLNDWTT